MSGVGAFLGGMMLGAKGRARGTPEPVLITPDYIRLMARYNAWQNHEIGLCYLEVMRGGGDAWFEDRKAFWGSIFGTLNHLIWGDYIWMARFEGTRGPQAALPGSAALFDADEPGDYWEARQAVDKRILNWAERLKPRDLEGVHNWYSKAEGREVSVPLALCVVHFFNHQAHHRGQVHTMVTQAGHKGWTTDLVFMPEHGDWLN